MPETSVPAGSAGPADATVERAQEASDGALARRAGMGDTAAFAELFARHFHPTYRYALHMLDGEAPLAEDATQEAWIRAWRHLPDYRGDAGVQTWLFKIVARQVLDARRRNRPRMVDDSLLTPMAAPDLDPADSFAGQELWVALSRALKDLPWRQRSSWLLREFEGLTYVEIARILDTTPTVVRGQLHRARASVAIRMEQWR